MTKAKSILAGLLIMVACLQTAWAQEQGSTADEKFKVKSYMTNKENVACDVSQLDSITFGEIGPDEGYEWTDLGQPSVPKIYNPRVDLKKDSLRILFIGHSYMNDYTSYLKKVIAAAGIPVTPGSNGTPDYSIYKILKGKSSFKNWYDCYYDKDNLPCYLSRVSGYRIPELGESVTSKTDNGALFRRTLNQNWDIIVIMPITSFAHDYSLWHGNGSEGYLEEFIRILKLTNPQASIADMMLHSYAPGHLDNTEKSTTLRWTHIAGAVKHLCQDYGIDFVIPCGTAIENLRASSLNGEHDFCRDLTHLSHGIGRYTSVCCLFQSIFAPRYGISVIGNTWRATADNGEWNNLDSTQFDGMIDIDDNTAPVAQKAAFLSTCDMWSIQNPDDVDL